MTQPLCRYCGKPIAKRTRLVWLHLDDGSFHVDRLQDDFFRHVYLARHDWPRTKADCQKLTNYKVVSIKYGAWPDQSFDGQLVSSFTEWDGESYKDKFFCSGDHAKRFGYLAAKGDMATKAYSIAMKRRNA